MLREEIVMLAEREAETQICLNKIRFKIKNCSEEILPVLDCLEGLLSAELVLIEKYFDHLKKEKK